VKAFTHAGHPARVVFGDGALARLREEIERLGARRALLLSTPGRRAAVEAIAAQLGGLSAGVYGQAVMHVPIEVAEAARAHVAAIGADCLVAIGGGSTVGLAKAVALTTGLPIVAVPTTYSGSEATSIQGITEAGVKKTLRDPRMMPKTIVYDPSLAAGLPRAVAAPSGINAIAHCVEALYAQDGSPLVSLIAEEGIRAIVDNLPAALEGDGRARGEAMYGAWLAGITLNGTSMAIHHKLCHVVGGSFNLPHADTHAAILPYATAYNRDAAPEAMQRIRRALGRFDTGDAASGLLAFARSVGVTATLRDIGMPADGLDRAADLAVQNPYYNPRPIERDAIRALLQRAYDGDRPGHF
jgi:alcohol dehydrogenase class IV